MLTEQDVIWGYRLCLNREPESDGVIRGWMDNAADRTSFVRALISSDEHAANNGALRSPFWHYHTSFDPIALIKKYARKDIDSSPIHVTNFLGVKVRPEVYPSLLSGQVGTVERAPLPANWHADIAEWGSCLRALDQSDDHFVMLELGCGWGCWMNNLGVTAKCAGKKIHLYGIEADEGHLKYARQALSDNGVLSDEYVLVNGIAGKTAAVALFPKVQSGIDWGGSAIINPTPEQIESATRSETFVSIPIVNIANLLKDETRVDLVHVDIQGAELDLLREVFSLLCEKVRYVFVGTHTKQIEAGLFDMFLSDGQWKLEMERAAIFNIVDGKPIVLCDGIQAWKNCRLG